MRGDIEFLGIGWAWPLIPKNMTSFFVAHPIALFLRWAVETPSIFRGRQLILFKADLLIVLATKAGFRQ